MMVDQELATMGPGDDAPHVGDGAPEAAAIGASDGALH